MSSSEIVIRVTNLSKCYQIYDSPRDRLKQFIMPGLRRLLGLTGPNYFREFWALSDVSFEVKKGETLGIIGRNGSGKSTLLQMICGTLTPTHGTIETNGRVAALLELGSGFNPEFTGRENVYLNASVLGLSKEEIDTRFDDIVAFADIGDFIEQPVKTYSSGMMVRLAFAVIAHVDADILVIDEALAVGDAFFTQKCMRFLRVFMKSGTVLFVSHDNASVKNLCNTALLLNAGETVFIGDPEATCNLYLKNSFQNQYGQEFSITSIELDTVENDIFVKDESSAESAVGYGVKALVANNYHMANGWKTGVSEIVSVSMTKADDSQNNEFEGGEKVRIRIEAKANADFTNPILGFILKDKLGQELFGENTIPATNGEMCRVVSGQTFFAEFIFKLPALQNGQYMLMVSLAEGDTYEHVHHHYLNDALIVAVHSSQVRFGIVGVQFDFVSLSIESGSRYFVGN